MVFRIPRQARGSSSGFLVQIYPHIEKCFKRPYVFWLAGRAVIGIVAGVVVQQVMKAF